MSAVAVFADILANWPQLCLIFTAGDTARHHRTHVHRSPKNPDILALVRVDNGKLVGISYVLRSELTAITQAEAVLLP